MFAGSLHKASWAGEAHSLRLTGLLGCLKVSKQTLKKGRWSSWPCLETCVFRYTKIDSADGAEEIMI